MKKAQPKTGWVDPGEGEGHIKVLVPAAGGVGWEFKAKTL